MRRYIIIIGAMKSGTTTLFDALARHPEIAQASNKEPGFFAFDEVFAKGYEWFDGLFKFDADVHQYRLEASTDYTKAPFVTGVWERMTQDPDVEVKLLYIMRHPLRRLESHARHTERHRREIGRQISPRHSHSFDEGISPVSLAISAYAEQLAAYQSAWQNGQLHCLTLEDLKDNPTATLADIWDFLQLEPPVGDASALRPSNVAAETLHTTKLWRKLTTIKPLLALGKTVLPDGVRQRLRDQFRLEPHMVEGRFALNDAEIAFLKQLYDRDMSRLQAYGIDTRRVWDMGPAQTSAQSESARRVGVRA
jgi:hypothetical protein